VLHISNTELVIDVEYTADRSTVGALFAGAMLRYLGRPISGYRPAAIADERGGVRIPLTVRTQLGRKSDELEVFLIPQPRIPARDLDGAISASPQPPRGVAQCPVGPAVLEPLLPRYP